MSSSEDVFDHTRAALEASLCACGLNPSVLSITYEDEIQGISVYISAASVDLSDPMLSCIADFSIQSGQHFTFSSGDITSRFWTLYQERPLYVARLDEQREFARKRLLDQGRLENLPRPISGDLVGFARRLEEFFGLRRGAALKVEGQSIYIRVSPAEALAYTDVMALMDALLVALPKDGSIKTALLTSAAAS